VVIQRIKKKKIYRKCMRKVDTVFIMTRRASAAVKMLLLVVK